MLNEATSRTIKLIMAFAIFWMVIGDLITYHQEKIFGANYYGHHTPFTKPGAKDDGKTAHWKSSKDVDKSQFISLVARAGIEYSGFNNSNIAVLLEPRPYQLLLQLCCGHRCSLRGPPAE